MSNEALIGVLAAALALLAILWVRGHMRLRRLRQTDKICPRCGHVEFHRVHRRPTDHLYGLGLNLRRYKCLNPECNHHMLFKRY